MIEHKLTNNNKSVTVPFLKKSRTKQGPTVMDSTFPEGFELAKPGEPRRMQKSTALNQLFASVFADSSN
jgi:hypothetical protein